MRLRGFFWQLHRNKNRFFQGICNKENVYIIVYFLNKEKGKNRSFKRMDVLQIEFQNAPKGTNSKSTMKYKVEQGVSETSHCKLLSLLPEMRNVPSTVLIPRIRVNKAVVALEDVVLIINIFFLRECDFNIYIIDIFFVYCFLLIVLPH